MFSVQNQSVSNLLQGVSQVKLGKNIGRIVEYGTTLTKLGSAQVFIRLRLEDGDETTWYGVPIKKDGDTNDIMLQQLAYCGFDPSSNQISDLSLGIESGVLVTDEDLDVYCTMQLNKVGEEELRINSIGSIGPVRADADAIKTALTQEQADKIKASANKFKVRVKKKKEDPTENIPF
jgi:hypothetical protein